MRVNKDGSGKTAVGPPSFRELADIRIHKYGTDTDLPGEKIFENFKVNSFFF